ncbi:hypothetical protein M9Y10_009121 [Tritrichomonas musculus]|uniref:Uncharacterized protein n=1 Tax=Tritrichomonas musculus TaxID=1915356 RepID=A0ABR2J145_9EUKA
MAQLELGLLLHLNDLKRILISLGDIENLSFNLKQNIVNLLETILLKTDENTVEWIWENNELIDSIIGLFDIDKNNHNHFIIALDYDIVHQIKTNKFSYFHDIISE